jgi:hypothetical protein
MKKFNYRDELKKIIASKQLVEVNFRHDSEHAVSYILNANDEYLTFARISNSATLQGVITCLTRDLESIQVGTTFITELSKDIQDDSLHTEASKLLENVKKFSFEGIVSAFEGTDTIIEVTTVDNDNFSGKVIALDDRAMVLDEYYPQDPGRFARTYLNPSLLLRVTVGGPWLKIISRSITNTNKNF